MIDRAESARSADAEGASMGSELVFLLVLVLLLALALAAALFGVDSRDLDPRGPARPEL
jgi:hypothetical protein